MSDLSVFGFVPAWPVSLRSPLSLDELRLKLYTAIIFPLSFAQ